jgi:KTSC domain-containing protein
VIREAVVSSNAKTVGYDPATSTLEVEFHNGAIWQYAPVHPEAFADAMEEGASVGKFVNGVKREAHVTATRVDVSAEVAR